MSIIKKAIGTVGIAWADTVSTQFMHSLSQLLIYSQATLCGPDEYIHYYWGKASYHELMRGELVDNMEGDWLLMLDTDHSFAPDLLERLLVMKEKHKIPIISGIYCYKAPPYSPVANLWGDNGKIIPLAAWNPDAELLQVGPVGAGCLLTDRDIFNRIKRELKQAPFHIIQGLSEDYSFCRRCRDLKIPIHLAMKVECHHLAPRNVLHVGDYVEQFKPAFEEAKKRGEEPKVIVGGESGA